MKHLLKKITPKFVLRAYHWSLAGLAAWWYGYPSEKLIVIGVTGSKGKSTTANLIAQLLEKTGHKVGLTSTAVIKVAEQEWLSTYGMTMPGRFALQKLLSEMVKVGCKYAVVETSSEGIAQFRSRGIHYDAVVLTSFFPEHIEAHGSYENYRAAKAKLFEQLKNSPVKIIYDQPIAKRVVLSESVGEYDFFSNIKAGEEWQYGLVKEVQADRKLAVMGVVENLGPTTTSIKINNTTVTMSLLFAFNASNTMAAITTCVALDISLDRVLDSVPTLKPIPGRQELIEEGQDFAVMVDYTHEPISMRALCQSLAIIPHQRMIMVLGPTGGGRDRWRRPILGELAAEHADVVIITTDDPYDDDPATMAEEMLAGAHKVQKSGKTVEVLSVIDRHEAITRALALAAAGDLVLIAGKGAEQSMKLARGQTIPWDDRAIVREELNRLGFSTKI